MLSVGNGLTPVAGQADARDLVYAVSHTEDHSFLTNVAIISISVIAFAPFFGDLIKQLKQLKHMDEVATPDISGFYGSRRRRITPQFFMYNRQ
ncbi:MAG: hypothetical protein LBV33_02315 [Lachnospiraceae bacterium]|nr:hypothetical protein [Lachnospiraceae bacterium]